MFVPVGQTQYAKIKVQRYNSTAETAVEAPQLRKDGKKI